MTDTEQRTTFFGIPVTGDIHRGDEPKDQRPLEEFGPILQAVLESPDVAAVKWTQYTPYFNDGEPCVFGANEIEVKFVPDAAARLAALPDAILGRYDAEEDDEDERGWLEGWNLTTYDRDARESVPNPQFADEPWIGPVIALDLAVEGGEFDRVLLTAFGDHANVVVTREGIEVEEYTHD